MFLRQFCCLFYLFILVVELLQFHLGNFEVFVLVNYPSLKWGNLACHCAVFEGFEIFRWAIRMLLSVLVLLYTTLENIISASLRGVLIKDIVCLSLYTLAGLVFIDIPS